MESKSARIEMLTTYLLNFTPRKILTSYILSSLKLNLSTNPEKINQIEKLIVKLSENNFFKIIGGYLENHATLELIFTLLNEINNLDPKKSEMFMSRAIAERLDSALKFKKKIGKEYLHEATFLVMEKDRKVATEFKISCMKFLGIFGFKNEAVLNIIAEQITIFLRKNKSISKLKMQTLQANENYEQLILSEDCDTFFHEKWFVPQNEFFLQIKSLELTRKRREEEKDFDEEEYIVPEENIFTHCSVIKNNSEVIFKNMINDVIYKSNNAGSSSWLLDQKEELQNSQLDLSRIIFETIREEKPVVTNKILDNRKGEKKAVETNMMSKNQDLKKPENFKFKIISGNISAKNSNNVFNSGVIKISNSDYQINDGNLIPHQGIIKCGRKGGNADINIGDIDNGDISRNQFIIQIKNNNMTIQCCCPPPGPTTIFKINELPLFLEKDQIITFGRDDDYTFRISEISNAEQEKYIIFQSFSLLKKELGEKFKLCNKYPQIIGDFDPLHSPFLKKFKIELGLDVIKKKWYIKEEKNSEIKSQHETFTYLFKYQDLNKGTSEPIFIQEKVILVCGDCYLMRE